MGDWKKFEWDRIWLSPQQQFNLLPLIRINNKSLNALFLFLWLNTIQSKFMYSKTVWHLRLESQLISARQCEWKNDQYYIPTHWYLMFIFSYSPFYFLTDWLTVKDTQSTHSLSTHASKTMLMCDTHMQIREKTKTIQSHSNPYSAH